MGDLIPLFRPREEWGPQEPESKGWSFQDIVSDEMAESLVETMGDIEHLWQADSEEELRQQFQFIKDTVATWPGVV